MAGEDAAGATGATEATICHVCTRAEWEQALAVGQYTQSTRGRSLAQVGFIHCSLPGQLAEVAERVYGDGAPELVVLVMERATLAEHGLLVRFEGGGDGTAYPHLYAALPCRLVTQVRPAEVDPHGRFHLAG